MVAVKTLSLQNKRGRQNQDEIEPDEIFEWHDRIQMEPFNDSFVCAQLISQPEAQRKQARVHQLMDLHPNLAMATQHYNWFGGTISNKKPCQTQSAETTELRRDKTKLGKNPASLISHGRTDAVCSSAPGIR